MPWKRKRTRNAASPVSKETCSSLIYPAAG
jgi:hypothetical protein